MLLIFQIDFSYRNFLSYAIIIIYYCNTAVRYFHLNWFEYIDNLMISDWLQKVLEEDFPVRSFGGCDAGHILVAFHRKF